MNPLTAIPSVSVTYTYYEQLNGYEYLKQLDIGYYFYSGSYIDDITKVLDPVLKTILHIPHVASRESTKRGNAPHPRTSPRWRRRSESHRR